VVLAAKPVRFALTPTSAVPDPIDCAAVVEKDDSVLEVPHSIHALVEAPFGFTLLFDVQKLVVTPLAAVVVTVGIGTAAAAVVKLTIEPLWVPALFCPAAR
jgi:hypothetical protein